MFRYALLWYIITFTLHFEISNVCICPGVDRSKAANLSHQPLILPDFPNSSGEIPLLFPKSNITKDGYLPHCYSQIYVEKQYFDILNYKYNAEMYPNCWYRSQILLLHNATVCSRLQFQVFKERSENLP